MSQRNVLILLAALVMLVVLVLVGQRARAPASTSGATFVPSLEAAMNDIERVTITKANNETIVTLERRPNGWVATNKDDYAADLGKLRQGLRTLAEAHILEKKTADPDLYTHLGVEDVSGKKAAGVAVAMAAGDKPLPTIILGNAEGSKFRYARRAGEMRSYLIDRNPDFPRTVGQWLDAEIIDVRGDRVEQVTITQPDGQIVRVSKAMKGATNYDVADVPKGRELLYPGVANVIGNALRELKLEDVEPAAASPPAMPVVVEFRTFDGLVVRVQGEKRGDAAWIGLMASVDAEKAAAAAAAATPTNAAAPATPAKEGDTAPADEPKPATPATPPPDPAAEAARINAKVGPWRYKIATFQYDQMTRRMSDLLKPPPTK
jgi:Domain of unknown function (DUF4340)